MFHDLGSMESDFHKSILTVSVLVILLIFISFFAEPPGHKNAASVIVPYVVFDNGLEPDLTASAVSVVRLASGQVLYAKNEQARLPVASITKLMTAVVVLESLDLFDLVDISSEAKIPREAGEKMSKIAVGEAIKTEDALKLIIIDSDNDIARALAENVSLRLPSELIASSFEQRIAFFIGLMNKKAEELGMSNSRFDNPAGLDSYENYASAEDLEKIVSYISKNHPRIWDISRIYETDIFSTVGHKYHLTNTNPLLPELTDIVGTKTGSTDGAKESLVLVVSIKKNDPIAFVILRSDDRIKDAKTLIAWVKIVYGL